METSQENNAKVDAKRTTTKQLQLSITPPEVHEYVPRAVSKNNSRTSKKQSSFNIERAYYDTQDVSRFFSRFSYF